MTTTKLYDLLEIDSPADFQYFEQLAELLECSEEISEEQFMDVLSQVDSQTMTELVENYFNELTAHLPDESQELFSLVDSIQQRLMLLADGMEDGSFRRDLAEELWKFKDWYTDQIKVLVDNEYYSVFEAVTLRREEKLGGPKHRYNFDEALDYQLEELSMNLGRVSYSEDN
jgi:hypothetical protein